MPGEPRSNQESFDAGYRQGADDERKAIANVLRQYVVVFREQDDRAANDSADALSAIIGELEARGAQPAERGEGAAMTTANDPDWKRKQDLGEIFYYNDLMDADLPDDGSNQSFAIDEICAYIARREKAAAIAALTKGLDLIRVRAGQLDSEWGPAECNGALIAMDCVSELIEKERAS